MLRFYTLTIFAILTVQAKAQLKPEFVKASIEFQNGQVLEGLVREDATSQMNYRVYFKFNESEKVLVKYDTTSIQVVKTESGYTYERIKVHPHGAPIQIAVLGELVVTGKASLYKFTYNEKLLFVVKNGDALFPLQDDEITTNPLKVVKHHYKVYLSNAVDGIPILKSKIEKLQFSEKKLIEIISEYNLAVESSNLVVKINKKARGFVIPGVGGMISKNREESFFHVTTRIFFPKFSKKISLNTGLNYFLINALAGPIKNQSALITVPVQGQYFFLTGSFRPYAFGGISLSYLQVNDNQGGQAQTKYGLNLLYGAGIEANIYKGLMAKIEYRVEYYIHSIPLIGIAYVIPLH